MWRYAGERLFAALELYRVLLRDFSGEGAHFFVDEAVGGEDDRAAELIRLAGKIGNFAAGFFHQQDARGGVPGFQAEFPETFEAANRDAGKVESGGAIAADSVRVHGEVAVVAQVGAAFAVVNREAGAQQAGGKRFDFGDVNFVSVERGAFAASRGEEFIGDGIVDYGGDQRALLRKSEGNAETRIAVGEIGGAVERIDVPAVG